jgi:predicted porin
MIYPIKYLIHKFKYEGNQMNFKKTALSTAVGATLAISGVASSVAQADGHKVQLYGRVNNAIVLNEQDGPLFDEDSTNVSTIGSRVGIKASAPISPDMTAHARFEWSASTDDETGAFGDTRIGEVGVTGDFGTVKIGNMWSTFYNVVGTHLDPTVTVGAILYSTVADLPYRVSNAIQYSNSFGAVDVSAEMRFSDEDHPDETPNTDTEKVGESDGQAIGASFSPIENLSVGIAVDSQDGVGAAGDEDRTGFYAKYNMDMFWGSISWAETDIDDLGTATQTQFHVGANFGNGLDGWVGFGAVEIDPDTGPSPDDAEAVTLNLTKRLGKSGFRVYYEGAFTDTEEVLGYDRDWHIFGARMDF